MDIDKIKQPLHTSLTEEITYVGIPKNVVILIGGLAVYTGVIFSTFYLLPLNGIMYIAALWMTQNEPQFFDIIWRYIRTKRYYHV